MITWDQPGYVVAFTTRVGGVSDGIYESLNLTARTGDDAAREAVHCTTLRGQTVVPMRFDGAGGLRYHPLSGWRVAPPAFVV